MASVGATDPGAGSTGTRRVLFLANSLKHGGAEGQLVRVALGLAERAHQVHVASLLDWSGYQDELRAGGVAVTTLPLRPPLSGPRVLAATVALLRQVRPHALVSFDYHANVLGRVTGRACGVPVVVSSIRGMRFGGPWREMILRRTDRLATVTTTNASAVATDLVARQIVSADRVAVVPNVLAAVPPAPPGLRALVRDELGARAGDFLWLCAGHLAPSKDHRGLLAAIAELPDTPPWRVAIAGDGEPEELVPLQAMAAQLGVAAQVDWLGWRDDVQRLLAAADGLVSASRSEGLPNVVLEALASGVPVVATRAGGTEELVEDGRSGFLVPVGDPVALRAAMRRLMRTPADQRARMGAAGRRHVVEAHDRTRVIDRWESLLGAGLDSHRTITQVPG